MHGSSNRSIVVISGLLTLLVLGGTTLAIAFHNGWLHTTGAPASDAVSLRAESADSGNNSAAPAVGRESPSASSGEASVQDDVAVYRQKLDEAYRALDDAYAQIRVLQAPQTRLASGGDHDERFAGRDGDDERRERRSHRRDSDDD